MIVERPWGEYEGIAQGIGWLVKRITLNPKHRLSLQFHQHREEFWIVIRGKGTATIGQKECVLKEGTMHHIAMGVKHRIENQLDEKLELIEVQLGEILSEDDITRIEDDYGREISE